MNDLITIKYSGREYSAQQTDEGILVQAGSASSIHVIVKPDEESARRWLGDHSLRKSKAKKLLAAALRNEGDFADRDHPKRCEPQFDPKLPTLVTSTS